MPRDGNASVPRPLSEEDSHDARAARQRALVERPEGALPAGGARPDRRAARGARSRSRAPSGTWPSIRPAASPRSCTTASCWPSRTPCCATSRRAPGERGSTPPTCPIAPRSTGCSTRSRRSCGPRSAPDRGGGLRPPRRPRSRRRDARADGGEPRSRRRCPSSAVRGPARHGVAVGLLRALHDRRRGGDPGAAPLAAQRARR